jgi:pyrimidine-nucleoside phosphorylase
LTAAMLASGVSLPRVTDRPRVDKHSTGGIGDSPSIILAPLLACFDLDVPMLSGRGLGITGGTLDKLEAFPGFRCNLTTDEISRQLQAIGCVITGTTPDIAPADRRFYALRDVTGTVESIPLITASIMCKKLAESLDALVLDVKFGSGAFMQTANDARCLANSLIRIGQAAQLTTRAMLTDMNQPLGHMVGNACEINEAIEVLQGQTDNALASVTLQLCSQLLIATGKAHDEHTAKQALDSELKSGRPLARLQKMIEWQGGRFVDQLPLAAVHPLGSSVRGFVSSINGRLLGQAIIEIGGGRKALGDAIDHSVGIEMLVRIGDRVDIGQPTLNIFAPTGPALDAARQLVHQAIVVSDQAPGELPLIELLCTTCP